MKKVTGSFQVKLSPQSISFKHNTKLQTGRLTIDKTFEGPLSGHSNGEMLSVLGADKKAGGYVAIEVFEGELEGISGSFAMQHYGKMDASGQSLTLEIVPNSGEGELSEISGSLVIRIENGQHYYDLSYQL